MKGRQGGQSCECGVLWSLTGGWDRAEVSSAKLDTSWGDAEICGVLTLS